MNSSESSGPPATNSKSSASQLVNPLESGGHFPSSAYFASTTPIQAFSGSSHAMFTSTSIKLKPQGTWKSDPVIPTGQPPASSSKHGTVVACTRVESISIPTKLAVSNTRHTNPTNPGRTPRTRTIRMSFSLCLLVLNLTILRVKLQS